MPCVFKLHVYVHVHVQSVNSVRKMFLTMMEGTNVHVVHVHMYMYMYVYISNVWRGFPVISMYLYKLTCTYTCIYMFFPWNMIHVGFICLAFWPLLHVHVHVVCMCIHLEAFGT